MCVCMCVHHVGATSALHCIMCTIAYHHKLCRHGVLQVRVHHVFVLVMYVQRHQCISIMCTIASHHVLCHHVVLQVRVHHVLIPVFVMS